MDIYITIMSSIYSVHDYKIVPEVLPEEYGHGEDCITRLSRRCFC